MPATLESATQHHRAGRLEQAEAGYREVLAREPRNADALHLLGVVAHQSGRYGEAIALISEAIALNGGAPAYHHNLGEARRAAGEAESALPCFARAIELRGDYADAFNNLGRALEMLGRPADARAMYHRAVGLEPEHAKAQFNLGLVSLLLGDFDAGWRGYEWRWRVPDFGAPKCPADLPHWDGSDPAGRTILVYCEQGFGDCIQFARYLPLLGGRGARVVVSCPPALVRLFASLPAISVVADDKPPPAADCCVAIASLPMMFRTTPATIPTFAAYLRPARHLATAWQERLRPMRVDGRRLIGLAWAGNPAQAEDRWRSLSLDQLAPLVAVPGVRFVSLQKGPAAPQENNRWAGLELVDFSTEFGDFADTAAAASQLDLVIAADTSVAHLAGALGKPTWTLVRFAADWRWALSGSDTAWYPSMRLFRQQTRGDWSPVIREIADALKTLARPVRTLAA